MASIRKIDPEVGMRCWLYGTGLNPRIPQRSTGTIVHAYGGGCHYEVELREWVRYTVTIFNMDCGWEFQTAGGLWIPESDPRSKRYLRRLLDDHRAGGSRIAEARWEMIFPDADLVEWVLRRPSL